MKLRAKVGNLPFKRGQILKYNGLDLDFKKGALFEVLEKSHVPFVKLINTGFRTVISKYRVEPYLILPTLEEVEKMNIESLSEEQLNEISQTISEALGDPKEADKVDDLDLQLAIWDCMEQYDIPRENIGALITLHGERLIGEVLAKQLIGLI